MIRNIVFDVGRVLVTFDPASYLEKIGYDENTRKQVMDAVFAHPLWLESDRGILSPEELLERFVANNPIYETQIKEAFYRIGEAIEVLPHTMDWLKELKARGYNLYVISNYGEYTYEQTRQKLTFMSYMNGAIFSCYCKMVKPEPGIYKKLLIDYELQAEECVFIDDSAVNVEGARAVGYHTVQFESFAQAKQELEVYLK